MPTNWKTVRVFISSTFRDMQAERDHLVRFVFPRLREQLLPRRIHLVDVDLRWGVTSEQDASEVCREIINECRPRFLCMLGGRYGSIPEGNELSITADEVHFGVLDAHREKIYALFYFRNGAVTELMDKSSPGSFREPRQSEKAVKLARLKRDIRKAKHQPFLYRPRWDPDEERLLDLKALGDRVECDILATIDDEFGVQPPAQFDEFAEENAAMEAFVEERSERFVLGSRETVLEELLAHTSATGGNGYVCLTGAPGSGKSALLAHLCQHLSLNDQPSTLLIRHFVGASPGSTDVRRTLRRLCHELKAGCPDITADIPDDPEKVRVAFPDFLRQASARQRVVILLDAVNQFDPASHSAGLHWLPEELPANARVILSTLDGPALEELRHRRHKPREIELQPLTAEDGAAIIEQFCQRYRKQFEPEQIALLLGQDEAGTHYKTDADKPLYLLAALEELRTLGTYEEITQRIAELPPTTHELFAWILKRLENDDGFRNATGRRIGRELVSRFAALLGASRYGLSQRELADLLDADDPQGNVAALLHLLRPYLMQRGELLDFYHGQFREAAMKAWLATDVQRQAAHTQLAAYFHNQENFLESLEEQRVRARQLPSTPRPVNRRKVEELVYQRLSVLRTLPLATTEYDRACEALENLLTNLFFLEAKTECGFVFELARDFSEVVAALPRTRPQYRILRLLEEALRRDIHFIARHCQDYPQALFQCLWNSCWWYDCHQAMKYYSESEGPWFRPGPKLFTLIEGWRTSREKNNPGFYWIRSLRPPEMHLGTSQRMVLRGHEEMVSSVAISPDGRRIVSGAGDNTVRIWDAESGAELHCLYGHDSGVTSVTITPDGQRIVSGSGDKTVRLWDVASGEELRCLYGHEEMVLSVAITPDGQRIVSRSSDKTVRVWRIESGEELCCLHGHEDTVISIAISPDGQRIVSGAWDNTVRIWDAESGTELHCLYGHEEMVSSVAISPDGRRIVSGAGDNTVRIWDAESGAELHCLYGHDSGVTSVTITPDEQRIVSGSDDRWVRVWDAESGAELQYLLHTSSVTSVVITPDGQRIVSGSGDDTVRVWDIESGEELRCFHKHGRGKISISPDGQRIVSGSTDKTVRVWDVKYGEPLRRLRGHEYLVKNVVISSDGQWIISVSDGREKVRVWESESGVEWCCLQEDGRDVTSVAISPDGRRIVSASFSNTIHVWDLKSGKELHCLRGHGGAVMGVAISADGQWIVSGSSDKTVRVWELESGKEVRCLRGPGAPVKCVAISADGQRIASGSEDNTVRVWDKTSGEELRCFIGHKLDVVSVAISPDGRRIVSGSYDKTVGAWDVESGGGLPCLSGHRRAITSVGISADRRRIVSSSEDNTVRVWDAESGKCLEIIAGLVDVQSMTAGTVAFPFRGVARGLEAVIEDAKHCSIAWWPTGLTALRTHPSGRIWVGASRSHLEIIRLEGGGE